MKEELIYCYDCGCEIEEGSEYQDPYGNSICEDCFDELICIANIATT